MEFVDTLGREKGFEHPFPIPMNHSIVSPVAFRKTKRGFCHPLSRNLDANKEPLWVLGCPLNQKISMPTPHINNDLPLPQCLTPHFIGGRCRLNLIGNVEKTIL
jgi:hypothetical protein